MTAPKKIPAKITDTENLGRELFSRTHARNRIPWQAFEKGNGNKGISVDRMDFADETTMARIGKRNAEKRRTPDRTPTFRGWAMLTAEKAKRNDRTIEYSWEEDNPYHSDIILPEDADPIVHARDLANASTYKKYTCKDDQTATP